MYTRNALLCSQNRFKTGPTTATKSTSQSLGLAPRRGRWRFQPSLHRIKGGEGNGKGHRPLHPIDTDAFPKAAQPLFLIQAGHGGLQRGRRGRFHGRGIAQRGGQRRLVAAHQTNGLHAPPGHFNRIRDRLGDQAGEGAALQPLQGRDVPSVPMLEFPLALFIQTKGQAGVGEDATESGRQAAEEAPDAGAGVVFLDDAEKAGILGGGGAGRVMMLEYGELRAHQIQRIGTEDGDRAGHHPGQQGLQRGQAVLAIVARERLSVVVVAGRMMVSQYIILAEIKDHELNAGIGKDAEHGGGIALPEGREALLSDDGSDDAGQVPQVKGDGGDLVQDLDAIHRRDDGLGDHSGDAAGEDVAELPGELENGIGDVASGGCFSNIGRRMTRPFDDFADRTVFGIVHGE
jgi:hypothetical protein